MVICTTSHKPMSCSFQDSLVTLVRRTKSDVRSEANILRNLIIKTEYLFPHPQFERKYEANTGEKFDKNKKTLPQ